MPSSAADAPPYVAGPLRLEPFRALRLAPARVGDPASARAFARPFRQVAARLRAWEQQGRILRDPDPAVHVHEYSVGGMTVRGLVGALDLSHRTDDPGRRVVMPHEGIHPFQVRELAERMTQMQLNPAPILLVHRGPAAVRDLLDRVTARPPEHDFIDRAEVHNRLWAIRAPAELAALADGLAPARAMVADGHHRYAAYLSMQQQQPGGAADRGLAMLVDQDDTPLFMGAIHRGLAGVTFAEFAEAATAVGVLRPVDEARAIAALGPTALAVTDGHAWASLELHDLAGRAAVELLDEVVVPALPGRVHRIDYLHSVEEAMVLLARKPGVAVLMPAPDFDAVRRILAADRLLPEKATSFQPKPSLGVLMRSLLDG